MWSVNENACVSYYPPSRAPANCFAFDGVTCHTCNAYFVLHNNLCYPSNEQRGDACIFDNQCSTGALLRA